MARRIVRAIHDGGHEIIAHSYGMGRRDPIYLDETGQRENIRRTTTLIADLTGTASTDRLDQPARTGSSDPSAPPGGSRARHHRGDRGDDDLPYLEIHGARDIMAIALTMDINDLPSAIRYGNNARAMARAVRRMRNGSGAGREPKRRSSSTAASHHTPCLRPGPPAPAVFRRDHEAGQRRALCGDVWVRTREEATAHARAALKNGPYPDSD